VLRLGSARLRTNGSVGHLVFSPDGTKLAAWSSTLYVTDTLSIWNTKSGRLLRRVDLPGAQVLALEWLTNGLGIALLQTGEGNQGPLVWEFTDEKATPKVVRNVVLGRTEAAGDNESDSSYAVSPDGKTLAVGRAGTHDKNRPILLRSLKAGVHAGELTEAKLLAWQPGNCGTMLFTPNGKQLVAFTKAKPLADGKPGNEQLVVVWNVMSGKEIVRFTAPRPADNNHRPAAAVSDRTLTIGLEDGSTRLWDLASAKETRLASDHVSKRKGQGYGTFAVAFAPDGKMLVTGGSDGVVKCWDVSTGKRLHTLERHYSWVEALAVSPDGRTIASTDGLVRLWDAGTGADICPQPGHLYTVSQAASSPDGKIAVTAGWDDTIRSWDTSSGRELLKIDLPGHVSGLVISPDGRTVLAPVQEDRLRTWDLASGGETTPADLPARIKIGGLTYRGALTFTPDGKRLIVASGPQISVLDWPGMNRVLALEIPKPVKEPGENACASLTVSPDGRWLVTSAMRYWFREEKGLRYSYAADGVVDVWDLATGKLVRRLAESEATFTSVTFTADCRLILVGTVGTIPAEEGRPAEEFKGEVCLLDPIAARWVRSFTQPPPTPGAKIRHTGVTQLSPDGRTLYVSYNTGEIFAFEVATGRRRRALSGQGGFVLAMAMTPDGRRLISGGHDRAALVWDVTLAGAAKPRKEPLTTGEAGKLWATSAGEDAQAAFAALADLAAASDRAVELLRRELKPIPAAPTDADLDRIFADLESEVFAARQKASRALAKFGESAVPGVRKRLESAESVEVRRRARSFLDKFDRPELSPVRLRQLRAVELLEDIGNREAKRLLSELAKGAAGAPLTLEAAAALSRLERH
jgi:WD40 repeat protein